MFYAFCLILFFVVFKQKTAYEMRISDWSSDVCSSDLPARDRRPLIDRVCSMQVNETLNEGLKREFTIVVPASEIDAELNGRLAELAPQMSLPGFRPGKVPPTLLKARFGDSILGEVLEKAVNAKTESALTERGLRTAGQPKGAIN